MSVMHGLLALGLGLVPPADEPERTETWRVLEQVASEHAKAAEVEEVVEHLRGMVKARQYAGRLSRVVESLEHPWTLPVHSAALRELLEAPFAPRRGGADFSGLVPGIADWLDCEDFEALREDDTARFDELWEPITDPEVVEMELLECLSAYVAEIHDFLDQEWSWSDEQRAALFAGHGPACEAWYRAHFPQRTAEDVAKHDPAQQSYQDVLAPYRPAAQLRAAAALMRLTEPAFLDGLAKRLARTPKQRPDWEGAHGDVVAVVGLTEESRVVLGGKRSTRYSGSAALIIDLGGKDEYSRAAVVDEGSSLVQAVIDITGDDIYTGEQVGPVCAVGGLALLVDRRGDDTYTGGRFAQASSSAGFAMLLDVEGEDTYTAEDFGQAYALCGTSLLYDLEGDDRYDSWAYSQGSGNGRGFSALVDGEGDDAYVADGHWPDVYGDSGPEIYHGAAQGFNLGFRSGSSILPGGIAALIDREGEDRYQAGNFSQGGGYFFGFGLMFDGAGDDETYGSRYAQGFGVHQAVGMRWDVAGDDFAKARTAANIGSAWDEGVGWFLDEEGDDVYEAAGLALGGAAQTAVAVFEDRGGKDSYRSANGAGNQGGAGGSDYHDKQSVGFLLDLGGQEDSYTRPGCGNDTARTVDWVGLFLDAREGSLAALLRRR